MGETQSTLESVEYPDYYQSCGCTGLSSVGTRTGGGTTIGVGGSSTTGGITGAGGTET